MKPKRMLVVALSFLFVSGAAVATSAQTKPGASHKPITDGVPQVYTADAYLRSLKNPQTETEESSPSDHARQAPGVITLENPQMDKMLKNASPNSPPPTSPPPKKEYWNSPPLPMAPTTAPCSACAGGDNCCDGCSQCPSCCCEEEESPFAGGGRDYADAWRLLGDRSLLGFTLRGWINGGGTANGRDPASRYNGPVTFNDRQDFYLDQLNAVLENPLETDYGWDIGGRVDFMYGTDARFTQAAGLELEPNGAPGWNAGRSFYQVALPQFYGEIGTERFALRMGHFYTIIGHELVTAPDNFFYSHAYTMQYGEPFTHTGGLATYQYNDQWLLTGGVHFGWDTFDANIDRASFLGGVFYTSPGQTHQLGVAMTSGDEPSAIPGRLQNRTMYSIVWKWAVSDRLYYVFQHDSGFQDSGAGPGLTGDWYGINQYVFYQINDDWRAGMRIEWFNDVQGTRVTGLGVGNPNTGPFAGDFYEITLGCNWYAANNVTVRPEVRWDWYDGGGVGPKPFNDGANNSQFLGALDFIVVW